MRTGIFYDLRNPERWFTPWVDFYAQTLEHMQAMEELGFEAINMTEHHFDRDGYCPSVLVWNGAIAARTKRVLVGQQILVLPLHDPVRVAEDIATIDILSGGRAWLRVGQGQPRQGEYAAFGVDPRGRGERFEEAIEIIRKCFVEDEFDHDGSFYKLRGIRVRPKPLQTPHPPIHAVGRHGTASIDRVARMGLNVVHATGGPTGLAAPGAWDEWYRAWLDALEQYGRSPDGLETSDFIGLFVSEDPERDWHKHKEGVLHALEVYRRAGTEGVPDSDSASTPLRQAEDIPHWDKLFVTPDAAVSHLRAQYGKHPPTWLIFWANRPGMTYEESAEHHRLLHEQVLPRLADLSEDGQESAT